MTFIVTKEMLDGYLVNEDDNIDLNKLPMEYYEFISCASTQCIIYLIKKYKEYKIIDINDIRNNNIIYNSIDYNSDKIKISYSDYFSRIPEDMIDITIDRFIEMKIPFNISGYIDDESNNKGFHNIFVRYDDNGNPIVKYYIDITNNSGYVIKHDLYITIGFVENYFNDLNEFEKESIKKFNLIEKI